MEKIIILFAIFMFMFSLVAAGYHTDSDAEFETEATVNVDANSNADAGASEEGEVIADPNSVEYANNAGISLVTDSRANGSIIINGVQIDSDLHVQDNLNIMLSDGENISIAISPGTAFNITANEFQTEPCFGNCKVELLETKQGGKSRAAYKVTTEKPYKFLSLFNTNADVSAEIDAETGAVIDTSRPWWTIFSLEVKKGANTGATVGENAGFGY